MTFGWGDLKSVIKYHHRDSAIYKSLHPKSWWYTPEVAALEKVAYHLEGANWQRGGCKGEKPKPPQPPADKKAAFASVEQMEAERKRRREHLAARRAAKRQSR